MSAIAIDKGVPLPALKGGKGPVPLYPWREMDVGDSFFVPEAKTPRITGNAAGVAKRTGFKFSVRAVTENGVKGVRVWRVS